jgi:cytochrome c553
MKKTLMLASLAIVALAAPALAQDAAAGEKEFNKCKACHSIIADDGTAIVDHPRMRTPWLPVVCCPRKSHCQLTRPE